LTMVSGKQRLCRPFFGQRQFFANSNQNRKQTPYVRVKTNRPFETPLRKRNSLFSLTCGLNDGCHTRL
jgi:hypothetical protein